RESLLGPRRARLSRDALRPPHPRARRHARARPGRGAAPRRGRRVREESLRRARRRRHARAARGRPALPRRRPLTRQLGSGLLARHAAVAYGRGADAFDDVEAAAGALLPRLAGDVTVLVKGSRAMGLERIVAALTAPNGGAGGGSC